MTLPDWYTSGAVMSFTVLAGPGLLVCLVLGVVGAIVQTTTQIREATLAFVPKVFGLLLLVLLGGSLMLHYAGAYATHVFRSLPEIVHVHDGQ